jgi:S-adenosylmethionine:tRNA ribosyltransferase-isomerase
MTESEKHKALKSKLDQISLKDYSYNLPEDRIAKFPLEKRDESKLLIYNRGDLGEDRFSNVAGNFNKDDLVVFNNSKVIQARLEFHKESGARIEIFCLEAAEPAEIQLAFQQNEKVTWRCLIGNLKKWKQGTLFKRLKIKEFDVVLSARLLENRTTENLVEFSWNVPDLSFSEVLEFAGQTPIPPYLNRKAEPIDQSRYQTVYSSPEGSVAAPTAGLHFSKAVLDAVENRGTKKIEVTLHVGIGTFRPIQSEFLQDHEMHNEYFSVTRDMIERLCGEFHQTVMVGTTSVRTLESLYLIGAMIAKDPEIQPEKLFVEQWDGILMDSKLTRKDSLEFLREYMVKKDMDVLHSTTGLMIVPGYRFKMTDVLITNFHMPGSSLILLVAAFVGEDWRRIYNYAMDHDFRFLSYGDSSILIPNR